MKNLRNNIGLFAALLGIMFAFAFKMPEPAPNTNENPWFKYLGGDESLPASYEKIESSAVCSEGTFLCAIQAPEEGSSERPTQAGVDTPDDTAVQPTPEL